MNHYFQRITLDLKVAGNCGRLCDSSEGEIRTLLVAMLQ